MTETIKSIFRQKEIEKLYILKVDIDRHYSSYNTHETASLGFIGDASNVITDKEIARYDVEIPMLNVGDEFFLHDLQIPIRIKSRMRSSDGSITYYAEDRIVETDNTQKSYNECTEKIERYNYEKEKYEKLEKEFDELKEEFAEYKKEYRYKNRFFNKKLEDCED